ncbi:MAG TPA: PAS domain-containing protein [Acidobacteriaceae bacterium]
MTPRDHDELLRSVALQNAGSILIARQRAERRNEAYLAEAQRISHTGSFGWLPSTGEIFWSEETFRIFQYDRTTTPSVELALQRTHPEDLARVKQTIERVAREGKDFDLEFRLLMQDGRVKYVRVMGRPLNDESGDLEFVGAVMDFSDRKRAEEELRRSEALAEQRLRLVVDTTPALINTCGPDGYLDYVNKGWLDYFGFSLETALDRADVMKMPMPSASDTNGSDRQPVIHPEDLPGFRAHWISMLVSGEPGEHEARARRFDGEYRWLLFRAVPLHDETGKLVKWYTSAFDIEDRKRAETLLATEKRLLEMIAGGDSCAVILDKLCRLVEELASGSLSSILLLDPSGNRLRHGAAPHLPTPYNQAIDGMFIGPSVGSCGTAAYRAEPVIVSDIATDPRWADFRDLALTYGLRACWSTPILSSAGKVLGTFAIYYREPRSPTGQDQSLISQITHLASIAIERKQAEQMLLQSEAYLHEAQRLGRTGSWARKLPSETVFASPELLRIFGYDPGEDKPTLEMFRRRVHPEDLAINEQRAAKALSEKTNWESNYRILLPDGSIRHVHSVARPILDDAGAVVEYIATVIDVTERKQADEERERLLASERAAFAEAVAAQQRFRDLVNSVEGIVWEADVPSFQFSFISKQAERVLGYPVERWLSEPTFWMDHLHPEDREWALEFCQSATAEKRDHDFEYRMVAADGSVVLLRDLVTVVVENDRPTRLRGVMVDIGKRKQAEEALRQALSDLAHVNRVTTMGELTASLAHEVNQPITAAVTNANTCLLWLTRDQPDLEQARAAAMRIVKDGTLAGEIVRRIRQLFQKGTPQHKLLDVNEVIGEMIVLLRAEATRYSISVRTELATDLPQVMGDRVQLQQVLMNLMMNGIDAMKDVHGARELTIKSRRAENEEVAVSVTDSGVGLPPQHTEKIFNAFFTTKPHGTGMGLRISRSIVESHGGRLWAAGNTPRGATFYFTLPTKLDTSA